jgi:hypothetical protein
MKTTFKTLQKHIPGIDAGFNNKTRIYYIHSNTGLETRANEILCSRHDGYYTNHDGTTYKDGSGSAWGVVFTLPAMPGFPDGRFLAGYLWGDNGERVIYPEMFDSADDAARAADSHAEYFAEMQREDSARFDAMQDAETECERAEEIATHAIQARNVSPWHRQRARESIDALRQARDALQDATNAYEKG